MQDHLRRLVKGVIPCDILCDPPLLVPGYEGPYDIILSSLCLSAACTTLVSSPDLLASLK